ncbi:hypothetical protein QWE_24125, partial [Agrobacterium albertimagni AOL15]
SYSFELKAPVAHETAGTTEENKEITIGFTVTDGDGDKSTGSLTVLVNDDVPVATSSSEAALEDGVVIGQLGASAGADGLASIGAFKLATGPTNGALVLDTTTGEFRYQPNANWHGIDRFTFTVTDGDGDVSEPVEVVLTISPVNDATVISGTVTSVAYTEIDGSNNVLPGSNAQKPFMSVDDGLTLSDVDSTGWTKISFTIAGALPGDGLQLRNPDLPS